jgi:putative sterol carrier protein
MLPFEIPKGTTLRSLVEEVVPAAHARLVPQSAGREPFTVAVEIEGSGGGSWVLTIDGAKMTVRAGEEKNVDARVRVRAADAQDFLDDWTGAQRTVPKMMPQGDLVLVGDPRILKRVKMVQGAIELAIRDFSLTGDTRRVALSLALGGMAKKVEPDPDVVIETSMQTYLRLLDAKLGPEEALADGDVTVRGKRLVAMQLAFAIAPLFPVPKK